MKLIAKNTKFLALFLLLLAFVGCEDDDGEKSLPAVSAAFTYDLSDTTGTVSFINTSENADSYQWDFGNGTTATEMDPTVTYASGTYTVSLTAKNVAGATDTFEDELVIVVPEAITLPVTFDNANVNYEVGTFNGATFMIVDNPAPGGTNDVASKVGAITNSGAAFEGVFLDLGTALNLAEQKTVSLNLWSETAVDVLLKLEQGTGADTELSVSHTGTGWENLVFNFTSADSFDRLTLFVDGPGSTAGTFYLDDIKQMETAGGGDMPTQAAPTPADRDAEDVISIFSNAYTNITVDTFFAGFSAGGGVTDVQVDGDDVKLYTDLDFAGLETIATAVDISSMTHFTLDVWTATEFDFIARVVDFAGDGFGGDNDTQADKRSTLTAGQWNTITVSLADLKAAGLTATPTDFSQLILDVVDTIGTVYVDNIYFYKEAGNGGNMGSLVACENGTLINDFETADDSLFNNFGGGVGTIIDNMDTAVNNSAKLAQYVKNNGEPFAGITIGLDNNIAFNAGVFSIDVNTTAERQLLFKLEGLNIELIQPTSGEGWQTLTYDFSSVANNMGDVTGITLIMDNGTNGDGSAAWTLAFDNIRLCSNMDAGMGGMGSLDVCDNGTLLNDFEAADDSLFNNFGGGVGTLVDNTDMAVNSSAKLAQYVKNTGEPFGGITIGLDSNIAFNAGVFSIDVNSTSVRQLLFKLEGLNIELIQPTAGQGWETLTYDFSSVANNMGDVTGITLIMDNGTVGDGSADWTILFDNMRLCSNMDAGMGGMGALEACDGGDLVNDLETADDSLFTNFGGGVGTVLDNTDTAVNSSAKIAQYVKNTGEPFGGITIGLANNIAFNAGVFSIDVNTTAVRQLLFKLEGLNIELIQPTSGDGWQTLTYDFSSVANNMGDVTGITLIMDNGTVGDGSADWTLLFDNIRLCSNGDAGGSGGCTGTVVAGTTLPLDFEGCESFVSAFSSIGDGGVVPSLDANPDASGINTSDNVLKVVRASGVNRWGGIQNSFPDGVIDITTKTFKIKVYSSIPDVTYRFELALDPQTDPVTGNPAPVFRQVSGGANTWTEIEFTFQNLPATPTTYNQLVIKPDNPDGSDGDTTAAEQIFYFDDLRLD